MFTYYWYLIDPKVEITARSEKRYSSIEKARRSAERYAINKLSHSDPEEIIIAIYRSGGACVYYDFVVPNIDMEGLNISEKLQLARLIVKIKPIGSMRMSHYGYVSK